MRELKLSLRHRARAVLLESDADRKLAATFALGEAAAQAEALIDLDALDPAADLLEPGRPAAPRLVAPRELLKRKLSTAEGRAHLIHAVAHIEFNAINLAWDAVQRFAGLPEAYYRDWASVAVDEARHFQMLRERLRELGSDYGQCPAHNGLWEMALATRGDPIARMALVPRLLEARGLDVTPGMIERLRAVGDQRSIEVLEVILREEVRHVAIGSHWFSFLCEQAGIEAEARFRELIASTARGRVISPFNIEARLAAGFSHAEVIWLSTQAERLSAL